MNNDDVAVLTLWIQAGAVVIAVGASIVALAVSAFDRRNARQIAAADRREALERSQLLFQQGSLLQLEKILRRGGHADSAISKDMGAESAALISAIGPELLPRNWKKRIGTAPDVLEKMMDDEAFPDWERRAIEAHIALMKVNDEIEQRRDGRSRQRRLGSQAQAFSKNH